MKHVLPVITGTREALINSATDGVPVIYVENTLYQENADVITEKLSRFGYIPAEQQGKRGVFFLLTHGEYRFDPEHHEIHDPLNIL